MLIYNYMPMEKIHASSSRMIYAQTCASLP